MKLTIAALALLVSGSTAPEAPVVPVVDGARGLYVEGRTASVFAGACHYGSEYTTTGREAVLAWRLEGGTVDGAPLAGIDVVVSVAGAANLAIADAKRWSVVYLPKELSEERAAVALAWLRAEHGAMLGEVRAVNRAKLELAFPDDGFDVRAGEAIELVGDLLPNRECCAMPHNVWYRPFDDAVAKPVVGEVRTLRCTDETLGRRFELFSVNCVFVGAFGVPAEG
jgi:hypothetical protein